MSGDPRETTGLIGAGWTAGNRLELTRPNGRRDFDVPWWGRLRGGRGGAGGHIAAPGRTLPWTTTTLCDGRSDVPVAESVVAPPGPIPNPVVTRDSAGEYCMGNCVGGEAAAGTSDRRRTRSGTPGSASGAPGPDAGWSSGSSLGS